MDGDLPLERMRGSSVVPPPPLVVAKELVAERVLGGRLAKSKPQREDRKEHRWARHCERGTLAEKAADEEEAYRADRRRSTNQRKHTHPPMVRPSSKRALSPPLRVRGGDGLEAAELPVG